MVAASPAFPASAPLGVADMASSRGSGEIDKSPCYDVNMVWSCGKEIDSYLGPSWSWWLLERCGRTWLCWTPCGEGEARQECCERTHLVFDVPDPHVDAAVKEVDAISLREGERLERHNAEPRLPVLIDPVALVDRVASFDEDAGLGVITSQDVMDADGIIDTNSGCSHDDVSANGDGKVRHVHLEMGKLGLQDVRSVLTE